MILRHFLTAIFLTFFLAAPLSAHEFVIKADTMNPKKGQTVNLELMAAHTMMQSDEMEDPKDVTAVLLVDKKKIDLEIKPNPVVEAKDLISSVTYPENKTGWLLGHRLPQLWSQTTDGMKAGDKKSLKGDEVLYTEKYEKFAKVLLNASADDNSYKEPVGHLLEIIPENNPASLKVGDELKVKILYNSKPIMVPVAASYDGFSKRSDAYAYYVDPASADEIYVKITHPGVWVVRAAHTVAGEKDIKNHIVRSVLEFEVK